MKIMMGEAIKYGAIFAIGAALGAGITYELVKGRYEQELNEYRARKFKEGSSDFMAPPEEDIPVAEEIKVEEKPDIRDYASIIKGNGYNRPEDLEKEDDTNEPCIISPDEFGEIEDYDQIYLTYYADGFLTDDENEIVGDLEGTVGWDAIDHIGEFEEDVIHVRNDDRECYYEILADMSNYKDIKQEE